MDRDLEIEVESALPTVLDFSSTFGEGHAILAMQAALPLGLTPELAHLIRVNFAPEVPWIAEVDLLLSPLCRPAGAGIWEMVPAIRDLLLEELRFDVEFGSTRLARIARFVYHYCGMAANRPGSRLLRDFYSAQRVVALAYLAPEVASHQLASAIAQDIDEQGGPETLRISRLVKALNEPLYSQNELVIYATGVGELGEGDPGRARRAFASLGPMDEGVAIGNVTLPAPNEVGQRMGMSLAAPDDEAESPEPDSTGKARPEADRKKCLVIQGFGKTLDPEQGKEFDLDASYAVIKEAVEFAGLECLRGDELTSPNVMPDYQRLLSADLVVADLTASDLNAIYELGVRHALRPSGTIVLAQDGHRTFFDAMGGRVYRYEHLGESLSQKESNRLRHDVAEVIDETLQRHERLDSPVYLGLPNLQPPIHQPEEPRSTTQQAASTESDFISAQKEPEHDRCLVIMGSFRRRDHQAGSDHDHEATYDTLIKPAIEAAGLACIRMPETELPMESERFELLCTSHLMVADLSTLPAGTIYELGIRHGLRPNTTIIIAARDTTLPFDLQTQSVHFYDLLDGGRINIERADQFRQELTIRIRESIEKPQVDSPVYTNLPGLNPAILPEDRLDSGVESGPASESTEAIGQIMEEFEKAKDAGDFMTAKALVEGLVKDQKVSDPELVRQLALVTYKSEQPDAKTALEDARRTLERLRPESADDVDTIGLWATIHRRLWEIDEARDDLDTAIRSLERGYSIGRDHYLGVNYSFLLNARASVSPSEAAAEDAGRAIAVRQQVIENVQSEIEKLTEGKADRQELFWLRAALAETLLGLGHLEEFEMEMSRLSSEASDDWEIESVRKRCDQLRGFLQAIAPE